jgi:transposase
MIAAAGAEACVPANRTHPPVPCDRRAHARRHRVENLRGRLKEWRAIATRYDKTANSFSGALHIAASMDWLSNRA